MNEEKSLGMYTSDVARGLVSTEGDRVIIDSGEFAALIRRSVKEAEDIAQGGSDPFIKLAVIIGRFIPVDPCYEE